MSPYPEDEIFFEDDDLDYPADFFFDEYYGEYYDLLDPYDIEYDVP